LNKVVAVTILLVAVGSLTIFALSNFLPINLESVSLFFSQLGYMITYGSLLVCLFTVIGTFLWYSHARKKFSSPTQHTGLSIAGLILATTILIIIIQIGVALLNPELLYHISFYLFSISLAMFAVRNIITLGGAYLHNRRERHDSANTLTNEAPLVSVIVPAYNEERAIGKTIDALLQLSYPNKEIIIVDDGSTDGTLETATTHAGNSVVQVITKPNGGKWDALNTGIKAAKGEFIVCMDADTLLDPDAIQQLTRHFSDPNVAAIAGNVKVGNRHGLLTKLQALEYVVGINLYRRSEASLQRVTVVPGPIGAFRASVLKKIGLFEGDTFAEDADITIKILKAGYETAYEPQAIGYTEAPTTMTNLAKQRYRWYRGSFQVLSKHKDMAFNRKYGRTGTFVMPWTIFNGVIYSWFMFFALMWLLVFWFNPISPYTIFNPATGGAHPGLGRGRRPGSSGGTTAIGVAIDFFQSIPYIYVGWFLMFTLIEIVIAAYALALDVKEKKTLIPYTIVNRLLFIYVLDIIRMLSQLEEAFHYPMKWEKIEHHGIETA
jgi:poly-beta-1,6 N-acetyl-D-glucosamine synthase